MLEQVVEIAAREVPQEIVDDLSGILTTAATPLPSTKAGQALEKAFDLAQKAARRRAEYRLEHGRPLSSSEIFVAKGAIEPTLREGLHHHAVRARFGHDEWKITRTSDLESEPIVVGSHPSPESLLT